MSTWGILQTTNKKESGLKKIHKGKKIYNCPNVKGGRLHEKHKRLREKLINTRNVVY